MQDLIKESASEFKWFLGSQSLTDEVLDWHTKQMEKAYEKGREHGIEEQKSVYKFNSYS